MQLYLSSYRLGNAVGTLLDMLGKRRRVAIVSNALDLIPDADRERYRVTTYDPVAEFAALGLTADLLDLREYFDAAGLAATLGCYDLVWVLGGNSFVLRRAMVQSGFDGAIAAALATDELIYGGFSAGAVVAAPTLHGIEVMDDPKPVPAGYESDIRWDGLGLVDFSIVPHVRSDHPEAGLADIALARMRDLGLGHRPLRDGEVIVRDGDTDSLLGSAL